MSKEKLRIINNEIKDYINESNFISIKCRNKIIKMLGNEFNIDFKLDNYQTIDCEILKNGHIIMYGDEYSPKEEISTFKEIEERYNNFKIKADAYLKGKDISFKNKRIGNNILNLLVILILILIFIGLFYLFIHSIIVGDYFNCIWLILFVFPWVSTRLKDSLISRLQSAKIFIKNITKKK